MENPKEKKRQPPGFHTTARELQVCTFEGPGASHTTKIPREDPHEKEERNEPVAGDGKKTRNFVPPTLRGPTLLRPPSSGPHPSVPHPSEPHPSGPHNSGPHSSGPPFGAPLFGAPRFGAPPIGVSLFPFLLPSPFGPPLRVPTLQSPTMTHTHQIGQTDWPKMDWHKLVLAKVGLFPGNSRLPSHVQNRSHEGLPQKGDPCVCPARLGENELLRLSADVLSRQTELFTRRDVPHSENIPQ